MTITRIDPSPRMSEAVIHAGTIYLAGQVGVPHETATQQTRTALGEIEMLLEKCGSSKNHLLMATIWLADIADFEEMNAVWDAWLSGGAPPARATSEARLADPGYKVEIIIIAAVPGG
jgi:enamine deaminase RidA (YjgF/YER057c/UK114 family)